MINDFFAGGGGVWIPTKGLLAMKIISNILEN